MDPFRPFLSTIKLTKIITLQANEAHLKSIRDFHNRLEAMKREHETTVRGIEKRRAALQTRDSSLQQKADASLEALQSAIDANRVRMAGEIEKQAASRRKKREELEETLRKLAEEYSREADRIKAEISEKLVAEERFYARNRQRKATVDELEAGLAAVASESPQRVLAVGLDSAAPEHRFISQQLPRGSVVFAWRIFCGKTDLAIAEAPRPQKEDSHKLGRVCCTVSPRDLLSLARAGFEPESIPLPLMLFSSAKQAVAEVHQPCVVLWCKLVAVRSPSIFLTLSCSLSSQENAVQLPGALPATEALESVKSSGVSVVKCQSSPACAVLSPPTSGHNWILNPEFAAIFDLGVAESNEEAELHTSKILAQLAQQGQFSKLAALEAQAEAVLQRQLK